MKKALKRDANTARCL